MDIVTTTRLQRDKILINHFAIITTITLAKTPIEQIDMSSLTLTSWQYMTFATGKITLLHWKNRMVPIQLTSYNVDNSNMLQTSHCM